MRLDTRRIWDPVLGLALFLACASCSDPEIEIEDYEPPARAEGVASTTWFLVIDETISSTEYLTDIVDGAQAWERALVATCPITWSISRGRVSLANPPADLRTVTVQVSDLEATPELGPNLGIAGGHPGHGTAVVLRETNGNPLVRRDFRVTVRHELGHAFGIAHQPTGVMSVPIGKVGVTKEDVDAFLDIHCPGATR